MNPWLLKNKLVDWPDRWTQGGERKLLITSEMGIISSILSFKSWRLRMKSKTQSTIIPLIRNHIRSTSVIILNATSRLTEEWDVLLRNVMAVVIIYQTSASNYHRMRTSSKSGKMRKSLLVDGEIGKEEAEAEAGVEIPTVLTPWEPTVTFTVMILIPTVSWRHSLISHWKTGKWRTTWSWTGIIHAQTLFNTQLVTYQTAAR